ncbi:MAG: hypothetical protein CMC15_13140, partial [Flavobacteriaceae bacterium]|nr:hypothetical protein [Flavobacteriaceae bacterium]
MTISTEAIKSSVFAGNGSTTGFAITFKTFSQNDLTVTLTNSSGVESVKSLTTHYTVSLNANQDNNPGGTVTMGTPPANGEKLVIANEPEYTQSSDIVNGGGFFPNVIEDMVDRNTILSRRAQEVTSRSIKIPISDSTGTTVELPTETLRASKAVVFDANGNVGVSTDNYVDQAANASASATAASTSATAAQSAASAVAIPFLMDTSTTMGDPAGTNFRLNNATVASVSLIAFGDTSKDGVDVSDYLMTWDDSTSTINGHLILVQEGTPANWAVFTVGAMTDNSDWVQCAVTHVDSGGSLFTNDSTVRCQFIRNGDKGDTGSTGSTGATGSGEGLEMAWEANTTDTDQGAGKCWVNGSSTVFYMDDLDSNAANINSFVDSWDDSGSTIKGRISVKKQTGPENYKIYNVTGSVVSASTYSKITVAAVVSAGTISDGDAVFVSFSRTGDKGETGGGLAAVVNDTSPQLGGFLDCNGNYIQMQKGGDIASASPTVIDTDGDYFICTGTTGFSAMTVAADRHFFLEFAGALTMTHGAGTLDLPGGANITTAAGDVGEFVSTAANVVTCVNYSRAGGIINADINASAAIADTKIALGTAIQAYDADTAKTDAAQTFTAGQRGEITALTDGAT